MVVVSDTSPINYLIVIGYIDLLPQLFGRVVIPPAVHKELSDPESPMTVRMWLRNPPDWLEVQSPHAKDPRLDDLDPGEREAILLFRELDAHALLVDDYAAFERAREEGIEAIRTLSIVQRAAKSGLVDLRHVISLLLKTNFRIRARVIEEILSGKHES